MKQQKSNFLRAYLPVLAESPAFQRFFINSSPGQFPEELQAVLENADVLSKVYYIVPNSEQGDKIAELSLGDSFSRIVAVAAEDFNDGIKQCVRQLHKQAPTLLWLEPAKQRLDWSTLEFLAYWKSEMVLRIDVTTIADWPAHELDRFFGSRQWESIILEYRGALRKYLRYELLRLYTTRLRHIGFAGIKYEQVQKSGRRRHFVIWAAKTPAQNVPPSVIEALESAEAAQLRWGL